jgi:hypothetical protein
MTETPSVEIRHNESNDQFVFKTTQGIPGINTFTAIPPRIVIDKDRHQNHIEICQDQLSSSGKTWRFHSVCINVSDEQLIALRDFLNEIYPKV